MSNFWGAVHNALAFLIMGGIGLIAEASGYYLYDDRTKILNDVILWHNGEAANKELQSRLDAQLDPLSVNAFLFVC